MTQQGNFTRNEKIYLSALVFLMGALAIYVNQKAMTQKAELKK